MNDRLTNPNGDLRYCRLCGTQAPCPSCAQIDKAIRKLAAYEDMGTLQQISNWKRNSRFHKQLRHMIVCNGDTRIGINMKEK